ncbi:hypothetical protein ACXWOO_11800, partial [Streptococcus pyogenes]
MDVFPAVHLLTPGKWESTGKTDQWTPLKDDPSFSLSAEERAFGQANRRVVNDWLDAIRTNREPICSGRAAMRALEM